MDTILYSIPCCQLIELICEFLPVVLSEDTGGTVMYHAAIDIFDGIAVGNLGWTDTDLYPITDYYHDSSHMVDPALIAARVITPQVKMI